MIRRELLLLAIALCTFAALAQGAAAAKIDVVADTYHIVDGDTIDAFPVGRIRFADIDTPESGQPGYSEAKEAVRGYTEGKRVYLDVDSVDVDDNYNRLVAVVYVRHNSTHLMNVNRALVDADLAAVDDFDNEFDPSTWPLYLRADGAELPTLWDPAHSAYVGALRNLSAAQRALDDAETNLTNAAAERDAALAELERVSRFLNGTVPASDEALAEINATRAELEETKAALATTQAQQSAERVSLQAEAADANNAASVAVMAGAAATAVAGIAGLLVGRRRRVS